jgi:DNA-binding MarR family transcriptional regulator
LKNPSISELAKELNLSKPTVTVLVEKLAEREYIRKVKSDEDRRFQHLHINTKGMKINSVYEIASEKIHNIFREKLSETEFEILLILISKIV